jgi:hypothetical protein
VPITVGPFTYLTHPVNFPCGRKPKYPGENPRFSAERWLLLFSHEDWVRVALRKFSLSHWVFTSFHLPNWRYVIWSVFKVVSFWIFLLIWFGLGLRLEFGLHSHLTPLPSCENDVTSISQMETSANPLTEAWTCGLRGETVKGKCDNHLATEAPVSGSTPPEFEERKMASSQSSNFQAWILISLENCWVFMKLARLWSKCLCLCGLGDYSFPHLL